MARSLLARLRSDGPVWALIAAMASMAAILFVLVVRHLESPTGGIHLPWWALALAFAAAGLARGRCFGLTDRSADFRS